MSTTIASASMTTSGTATTSTCTPVYQIPTTDAACAVNIGNLYNATAVLKQCCGSAPVVSYENDCASYCLAIGQDINKLSKCFIAGGLGTAFCNNVVNATATGTVTSASATGSVSSAASTSGSGTTTAASGATNTATHGAAAHVVNLSAGGISVIALLFCSALFGTLA